MSFLSRLVGSSAGLALRGLSGRGASASGLQLSAAWTAPAATQKRFLNLHEYQSKQLCREYDVRVQRGEIANSAEEARRVAQMLKDTKAKELIIKAQIHAGGRGKGHFSNGYKGGVQICTEPQEIAESAQQMLGNNLITKQTGPEGQHVETVLVHEGVFIERELYFAILMDRAFNGPVIVASKEGGVDIEEVAESNPDAIIKVPIDIMQGIQPAQTEKVARALGFEGDQIAEAQTQMANLYKMFIDLDATMIEINPLAVDTAGVIYCVDAKLNFDDNASFRQKRIFDMRDKSMEDPRDVAASDAGLNYIGLDGNIGCMVNGAGLAMATMDIIKLNGAEPANFLDVGGGANEEQVTEALRILTSDPRVKAILVNIFGGIMKCDIIAQGIVAASKNVQLSMPLVVRLEGTNVEQGKRILKDSGINVITADDLDDAARKAVSAVA